MLSHYPVASRTRARCRCHLQANTHFETIARGCSAMFAHHGKGKLLADNFWTHSHLICICSWAVRTRAGIMTCNALVWILILTPTPENEKSLSFIDERLWMVVHEVWTVIWTDQGVIDDDKALKSHFKPCKLQLKLFRLSEYDWLC